MASYDRRVPRNERYLLDNQQAEAGKRFDALSDLFNPSTFRHFQKLGITAGWRVWEVGAGAPSVPTWLAEQVGPTGQVVATDIDTSWIDRGVTGFEVQRHDVGTEPAPRGPFDLVHARLVLVHVHERSQALATMIDALRPGGWLLSEEADPELQPLACIDEWGPEQQLANKLKRGFRSSPNEVSTSPTVGRCLVCCVKPDSSTCSLMPTFRQVGRLVVSSNGRLSSRFDIG
jgi:SAM-dependent methyltransferase